MRVEYRGDFTPDPVLREEHQRAGHRAEGAHGRLGVTPSARDSAGKTSRSKRRRVFRVPSGWRGQSYAVVVLARQWPGNGSRARLPFLTLVSSSFIEPPA